MGFSGRGNGFRGGWKGIRRGGGRGRGRGYGFKSSRRLAHSSWGSDEPVQAENADPKTSTTERKSLDRRKEMDFQDSNSGVEVLSAGSRPRLGWLYNMASVTVLDSISEKLVQGADLFFIGSDGADFRATAVMRPYLYLSALEDKVGELETSLLKLYPELIACCTVTYLEDLDAPNHLSMREGRPYLKVESWTMKESNDLRQMLIPFQRKNQASKKKLGVADAAELEYRAGLDLLDDIREYDVSPLNRIAIDMNLRAGHWYRVDPDGFSGASTDVTDSEGQLEKKAEYRSVHLERVEEILERATPTVLAYDIECTKQPLRFPDADEGDKVMMISWMIDGHGFLGVNREVVSADIAPFSYTPKPEFPGDFVIFNEPDEKALLERFFEQYRANRPRVVVTYNGDNFDFPFLEKRADANGLDMYNEIGFKQTSQMQSVEYRSRTAVHLDCLYWVNRDSYLPQGSRGLKAVTKVLLGYDPLELDPEEMTPAAKSRPHLLASYSVSDAVCTYYLYMKYVHPFVFSLCTILPLNPDDVLRKGSGTLCELLLMSEAKEKLIVAPNKHEDYSVKHTPDGHMLENETYIGGHVEALQSGIFRSDIPMKFRIDRSAIEELEKKIDSVLIFAVEAEAKKNLEDIINYDELKESILNQLAELKKNTCLTENPLIYHLDVGAMYPNIILTNRLQPHAIVDSATCAACDFNGDSNCQRYMKWTWRGEHYTASRGEVEMLKRSGPGPVVEDISDPSFMKRLKEYSRKNYRRITDTRIQERVATVCQRENSFYVDTVRAFRDRRYDLKQMLKRWKKKLREARERADEAQILEAESMIVLYDSLQLAHKCILNSFYGYVMRRGARWYSMEMAGVVTQTGAHIIRGARQFIERIGVPLELDTDGIWCTLPKSFPENFVFKTKEGQMHQMSFICSVFNQEVHQNFSNHQYQYLNDKQAPASYEVSTECSIFFEVDGPYKAMILPASKEENKQLKKRYAVFNDAGKLVELKGFEIKRRGELKLVKVFQGEVFNKFLDGSSLEECYDAVASVANRYLDVLEEEGHMYDDESLIALLMEQNNMSRSLAEYITDGQKSLAITTAKRLAELLGEQMVRDKLTCKYIVCKKPEGVQVTERAIPIQVFGTDAKIRKEFLRRWTKETEDSDLELRALIDWEYYAGRLVSSIQKIICIPAALQELPNPVPRIELPDWLAKKVAEMGDPRKQKSISSFLVQKSTFDEFDDVKHLPNKSSRACPDMEDITNRPKSVDNRAKAKLDMENSVSLGDGLTDENETPDPSDGYVPWLRRIRRKWKMSRKKKELEKLRKKRSTIESDEDDDESRGKKMLSRRRRARGIGSYFDEDNTRPRLSLLKNTWEVFSIVKAKGTARYQLWIRPLSPRFDDGPSEFYAIPLRVPRSVYVNSRLPKDDHLGKEAKDLVLPRGQRSLHLYKVMVDEAQEGMSAGGQVSKEGTDIEGVYETKTPDDFNALIRVGCLCKPKNLPQGGRSALLSKGLCIDDLEPVDVQSRSLYLAQEEDRITAFLYVADSVDGSGRMLFGLLTPLTEQGLVVGVSQSHKSPPLDAARMWKSIGSEKDANFSSEFEFTVANERSAREAGKLLHQRLEDLLRDVRFARRTILSVQSSIGYWDLLEDIPNLRRFPSVHLHFDRRHREFQPVQWLQTAFRNCLLSYADLDPELSQQKSMARFADIPLGNVSNVDPYIQALDTHFARNLRRKNHLLWASEGRKPDIAGYEDEDSPLREEDRMNPEYIKPGAYRTVCVETELTDLALGSVLASAQLNEADGTETISEPVPNRPDPVEEEEISASGAIDDVSKSLPSFRILRDMLANMQKLATADKESDEKEVASSVMEHFYRWLGSEDALMYDPSLHFIVHSMMKKVFRILLTELKNLGAQVAYASVSKIVLVTPKNEAFDGLRYAAFIESTLREKAMFGGIRFAPLIGVYQSLLFADPFNYSGVPALEESSILEGKVKVFNSTTRVYGARNLPPSRMSWEVVDYLPTPVASLWMQTVDAFIRHPLQELQVGNQENRGKEKGDGSKQISEVRNFLKSVTPEIFESIQQIQEQTPSLEIPTSAILKRKLQPPVLEYVTALMRTFSLDDSVQGEVSNLRRSALLLLNVPEFSASAKYSSPKATFRLPNVICSNCKFVVDLEVTKDAGTASMLHPWSCTYCECPYDKHEIELALMKETQASVNSYVVQDLQCVKCKMIKQDNLQEHCACSGSYRATFVKGDLDLRLKTLREISSRYELPLLHHATSKLIGKVEKST